MSRSPSEWRPRRVHRRTPYYKVQVYDDARKYWTDERGAFDTVEQARAYIASKLESRVARIVVVEEKGRHVLDPEAD